jgi:hypothetical protein
MQQQKQNKGGRCISRASHMKATRVYDRQRIRTEKNKKNRREKHLKNNPNDLRAKVIIKQLYAKA